MKNKLTFLFASLCVLVASGCNHQPRYKSAELQQQLDRLIAASGPEFACDLQQCFGIGDGQLKSLIDEGLKNNYDNIVQRLQLDVAGLNLQVARAQRGPRLGLSSSGTDRNQAAADRAVGNVNPYTLLLQTDWELDVWGRLSSANRADDYDYLATALDYKYSKISLASSIARAWFAAVGWNLQYQLDQRTFEHFKTRSTLLGRRFDAGLVSPEVYARARAEVADADARASSSRQTALNTQRQLEVLLGRYPKAEMQLAAALPELSQQSIAYIPGEVIGNRPDLIAAEQRIKRDFMRISSAKANLYPRFSLTGSTGKASDLFKDLLSSGTVYSLSLGLFQPLFESGRLKTEVTIAQLTRDQSVQTFLSSVLNAYSEIETALSNEEALQKREQATLASIEAIERELRVVRDKYEAGVESYRNFIETELRLFEKQGVLLTVRRELLENRVVLYLAAGGRLDLPDHDHKELPTSTQLSDLVEPESGVNVLRTSASFNR